MSLASTVQDSLGQSQAGSNLGESGVLVSGGSMVLAQQELTCSAAIFAMGQTYESAKTGATTDTSVKSRSQKAPRRRRVVRRRSMPLKLHAERLERNMWCLRRENDESAGF
ncbi:MAG: hypothetical protein RL173_2742 [Fibrobacterota bacterium]|jgi:hypothetical protein